MSEPYCSNCNYTLSGLTESSKCPECGKPLVEVLTRKTFDPSKLGWGRRYKSKITLFGLPLLSIAMGPAQDSPKGVAKGIIAIGDQAYGLLAIGGLAVGLVSFGGMAMGGFSIGGFSLGLLAWGGMAVGGFAMGGGAVGLIAIGGGAAGAVAVGGAAYGYYAAGGGGWGEHILTSYRRDDAAVDFFTEYSWLLGKGSPGSSLITSGGWMALVLFILLLITGLLAAYAYHFRGEAEES